MPRTPMPSPFGTNRENFFLPWPANPAGAYDAMPRRLARDQSPLNADDAIAVVNALLTGLAPEESDAFRARLAGLLAGEEEPSAPDRRPPGADRRLAQDHRLPRGVPSFAERFPNAARVRGEGGTHDRLYRR